MENRPHRKDGNGSEQGIRKFYSRCTKKAALPFRCDYNNHCLQRSPRFQLVTYEDDSKSTRKMFEDSETNVLEEFRKPVTADPEKSADTDRSTTGAD